VAALAVLIPPNAFAGAGMLDWIGLVACIGLLGWSFLLGASQRGSAAAARS